MVKLEAKERKEKGKKVRLLRNQGRIPAILYGPQQKKGLLLTVEKKEFDKVFKEVGENQLVSLEVEGKETPVLIYKVQRDPVKRDVIHIDFYQPPLDKKIEIMVPIVFEGEAPAVKELGGTLIKNIQEVKIRALPTNLPHEIKVSVENLESFEDKILVQDLPKIPGGEILRDSLDIVAQVVPPEKVEEELAKPVEEKVEAVERVEKPKPSPEAQVTLQETKSSKEK